MLYSARSRRVFFTAKEYDKARKAYIVPEYAVKPVDNAGIRCKTDLQARQSLLPEMPKESLERSMKIALITPSSQNVSAFGARWTRSDAAWPQWQPRADRFDFEKMVPLWDCLHTNTMIRSTNSSYTQYARNNPHIIREYA